MRWSKIGKHPLFWLAVMVGVFFVVSVWVGVVTFDNFATENSTDTGIITQAVASATFGHRAPFYESYDCLGKDRCSLMLVHPGFVLYVAAPFYALAPSTLTLFALRSLLVAAAAFPLYWLTRQVTKSTGKALFAAGLYLVWAPTLSGDVFSLHLESLLPVEFLALAALWQAGRYRWGLMAAIIAFLTIEIAPVFVFLVGLFFLVPYLERFARWSRKQISSWWSSRGTPPQDAEPEATWVDIIADGLQIREVRYTLVLMAASLLAYVALCSFMNSWGAAVLAVSPPTVPKGIAGLFYNSSTPAIQSLGVVLSSPYTVQAAEYWLILYGLVAFLPLLCPRALVISVPWIGYTFLTTSNRFTAIGSQYTMVAAVPIFVGLAYGLARLPIGKAAATSAGPSDAEPTPRSENPSPSPVRRRRSRIVSAGIVTVLAVVVVVNVLFSPICPALPDLGYSVKAPFRGGYFDHSLTIEPGIAWAENLVKGIPENATIAATTALFPLLANYPYAIVIDSAIQPFADPSIVARLPFNLSAGPQFVLTQSSDLRIAASAFEPAFFANLSNPDLYGMEGYVSTSAVGPLFLFEKGFSDSSAARQYGPAFAAFNETYAPGKGIVTGSQGRVVTNVTAPDGKEIQSAPKATAGGEVWAGPNVLLPPGDYSLSIEVSASGKSLIQDPSATVLGLVVRGFGPTLLNVTFPAAKFSPGVWTNLTVNLTVPSPLPIANFEGFLLDSQVTVAVASLAVEPNPVA